MKLDIGSGEYPARNHGWGEGWTTVDAHYPADVKADMGALPYEAATVDEILCSHSLEHVEPARVPAILAEWMRVLRPGGRLIVQVPDLDYVIEQWRKHPGADFSLQLMFGLQRREGDNHCNGWNATTLRAELMAAGFVVQDMGTIWSHTQQTLRAICLRPGQPVQVPKESLLPKMAQPSLLDDRVLVACPTYSGLEYCLDDYLAAYDRFVWPERSLMIVDNTRDGGDYARKIERKVVGDGARRFIRHVEPLPHWEETFKRCWDVILNHAHFNGIKFVLSLEQDVIIPPLGLDALLNVSGYTGAPFVTHWYPFHGSRPAMYEGLGCVLMHTDFLDHALNDQYRKTPAVEAAVYACANRVSSVHLRDMFKIEHRDPPAGTAKPWQFEPDSFTEADLVGVAIERQ